MGEDTYCHFLQELQFKKVLVHGGIKLVHSGQQFEMGHTMSLANNGFVVEMSDVGDESIDSPISRNAGFKYSVSNTV